MRALFLFDEMVFTVNINILCLLMTRYHCFVEARFLVDVMSMCEMTTVRSLAFKMTRRLESGHDEDENDDENHTKGSDSSNKNFILQLKIVNAAMCYCKLCYLQDNTE